jgi:hypothetical protein
MMPSSISATGREKSSVPAAAARRVRAVAAAWRAAATVERAILDGLTQAGISGVAGDESGEPEPSPKT